MEQLPDAYEPIKASLIAIQTTGELKYDTSTMKNLVRNYYLEVIKGKDSSGGGKPKAMSGLAKQCGYCHKNGHHEGICWVKKRNEGHGGNRGGRGGHGGKGGKGYGGRGGGGRQGRPPAPGPGYPCAICGDTTHWKNQRHKNPVNTNGGSGKDSKSSA